MVRRTRKHKRHSDGKYHINGKKFQDLIGSRAQVMHNTAFKTSAGRTKSEGGDALTRANLKFNKNGRIVSVAKSAKKGKLLAQLRKAGYTYKKGHFGAVKIGSKGKGKGSRCRHKTGKKKCKFKKCRRGGSRSRRRTRPRRR